MEGNLGSCGSQLTFYPEWRRMGSVILKIPTLKLCCSIIEKHLGRDKFKYDHTDSQWIDVDCIICTVTISYNPGNEVYCLDRNDAEQLDKFVTDRNS